MRPEFTLVLRPTPPHAEAYEALWGAIYVDCGRDMEVVQGVYERAVPFDDKP